MAGDRFLVSARKYRPQTFSELVSQEHVAETLRNALRLDRVAHAYLFCGPRGVGKTSAARILAKAINCETPPDQRTEMDPCRTCDSCRSFEEGRSLNVIEIDAASNNGVDDIRALREAVRIPPPSGVKKVYIVDEVHMLSKQAFNALLKTLEEPPPFIQFIFATTEPHKLLPTVQSRCQRFDFRRISVADIVERLRAICDEEGIEADEASLRLIARKGDGALRDAFSTFDQAVILGGKRLVYNEIVEALGAVNIDTYFETTDLVADKDRAGLLGLVERLATTGTDFDEFLSGLTDHLRDLLITLTTGQTDLIEADKGIRSRYAEQAGHFAEPDLLRHLIVVNEGQEAMKRAVKPRLRLELTLLKMASLEKAVDLQKIIDRLESLDGSAEGTAAAESASGTKRGTGENARSASTEAAGRPKAEVAPADEPVKASRPAAKSKLAESKTPPSERANAAPPVPATPLKSTPAQDSGTAPKAAPAPEPAPVNEPTQAEGPTRAEEPAPVEESTRAEKPTAAKESPSAREATGAVEGKTQRPAAETEGQKPVRPADSLFGAPALKSVQTKRPAKAPAADPKPKPEAAEGLVKMTAVEVAWSNYVKDVTSQRIHVGALLQHTKPASVNGDTVSIAVPDDFHERLLAKEADYLSERLRSVMSVESDLSMRFFVSRDLAVAPEEGDVDPLERVKKLRQDNPIIKALFDEFGGELVW